METRRHIFGGLTLAVAALLCLAGCKKDEEGEKVVLGVDFEQTAGTQKTYIGNSDKTIYWSTDDNVQVNGTNYLVHDGVVEVNMCDDGYAAVYPVQEGNSLTYSTDEHSGKTCIGGEVVIPATQTYAADANGIQQLNGPMAARLDTKTGRLLFRNLYAVIKVTVKAKETEAFTLNSITVESTNSVNLAGTQPFTFDAATNTATPTLGSLSNGSKSVTLTFAKDTTIPANGSASFYLYTVPFSGAALTVKINGNMIDNPTTARDDVSISRSQLRGTTVDAGNLKPIIRFSVDAGKFVTFSPGNLRYLANNTAGDLKHQTVEGEVNGMFRFAEHQWDYIGDAAGNTTTASDRDKQSDWIDLFGWGTSGWNNGNKCYQPYDNGTATSGESSSKGYGYGPTNGTSYTFNLTGTYENSDWGVYNEIQSFDGNTIYPKGTWRTLTNAEWSYLLGTSGSSRGGEHSNWWIYNMVKITDVGNAGVTGLIIYPDGVTGDITGKLSSKSGTSVTEISKAEFETLEAMGCVFLPAAGYRIGRLVYNAGSSGRYWSSTYSSSENAYGLNFSSEGVYPSNIGSRYLGQSVRLVKDVE